MNSRQLVFRTEEFRNPASFRHPDDIIHAGNGLEGFGGNLSVAAGYDDLPLWIPGRRPPDELARLVIRLLGYGARMDDGRIRGLGGGNHPVPPAHKLCGQRSGITLVGFAPQGDHGDPHRALSIHPPPKTSSPR